MKYLVLSGGTSPERAVSTRSASAVAKTLHEIGHEVIILNPAEVSVEEILRAAKQTDGIFPILHGKGGEDGTLQALFEKEGIPYFGPSLEACNATYDKVIFKKILEAHGLPTPRWNTVTSESFDSEPLAMAAFVLKPIDGGSSIDTFIIRSLPFDAKPLKEALGRHKEMLIEELIEGDEVTVGILGSQALPVVEIIPPKDKEFDYENKYNGATQELCPPVNVNETVQQKAQALALAAHEVTRCRHLSRTDLMINSAGELFIIDTNTIPGLTDQSLFPKAAKEAGYEWADLVKEFVLLLDS